MAYTVKKYAATSGRDYVDTEITIDEKNLKKVHKNLKNSSRLYKIALMQSGEMARNRTVRYIKGHKALKNQYRKMGNRLANSLRIKTTTGKNPKVSLRSGNTMMGVVSQRKGASSGGLRIAQALDVGTFKGNDPHFTIKRQPWHKFFSKGKGFGKVTRRFRLTFDYPASTAFPDRKRSYSERKAAGARRRVREKNLGPGGSVPVPPGTHKSGNNDKPARIRSALSEGSHMGSNEGYAYVPPLRWLDQFGLEISKEGSKRVAAMTKAIHAFDKKGKAYNFNVKRAYQNSLKDFEQMSNSWSGKLKRSMQLRDNKNIGPGPKSRTHRAMSRAEKNRRARERRRGERF